MRDRCWRTVLFSSLDSLATASVIDLSVQWWSSSPKFRAVPPAGSRARSDRRSVYAAPHVSREFVDHYDLILPGSAPNSSRHALHAGWRAVFTSAESFSTLRLCSTGSRAGVTRQQQRARPLWRWLSSTTYQLFEDLFPQERTQLGSGVMKFSFNYTQLLYSSCIIIPRATE